MSLRALTTVWNDSKATGTLLLLELALADTANEKGWAWPGIDFLADKARMSRRSVVELLQRLEELGELLIERNAGPRGTNMYLLLLVSKGAITNPDEKGGGATSAPVQLLHGATPRADLHPNRKEPDTSTNKPSAIDGSNPAEWPSLEQVLKIASEYPGDMATGIPAGIPEQWARNYFHWRTFERQSWPDKWREAIVFKFTTEWIDGVPAARGKKTTLVNFTQKKPGNEESVSFAQMRGEKK